MFALKHPLKLGKACELWFLDQEENGSFGSDTFLLDPSSRTGPTLPPLLRCPSQDFYLSSVCDKDLQSPRAVILRPLTYPVWRCACFSSESFHSPNSSFLFFQASGFAFPHAAGVITPLTDWPVQPGDTLDKRDF